MQLLLLFLIRPVYSSNPPKRVLPALNNHYFMPIATFPSPFITTFFLTGVGGGSSINYIPLYWVDGQYLGRIEGKNTFVSANIHIKIRAKYWLATWFRYEANARIGSSTSTLLAQGITSFTGFEFGWMFRLWHDNRNQLSTTIQINNTTISAVNLLKFMKNLIDSPDSIHTTLTQKRNPLSGAIGLRYAHAFNDLVGLKAVLNGSYGEAFLKQGENVWRFDMGLIGSLNFNYRYHVPIGLTLGYTIHRFALFESDAEDQSQSILFKIAYVGREEYNMGLEMGYIVMPTPLLEVNENLKYFAINFVVTYIF